METIKEFLEDSLTLKQVAQYLGYTSVDTVRRKMKRGEIPGFKSGNQWRSLKSWIKEYVQELEEKLKSKQ